MRPRAAVAAALILAVLTGLLIRTKRLQWDLKVYLLCSRTLASGGDPYASMPVLDGVGYQCLYPPIATDLYRPFAAASDAWGREAGERLWAALKVLSLFLMLWLWRRWVLRPGPDLPRALFAAVAYGSPFWNDFRAGNASSFEHLVLWGGLAAFVAGKDLMFASLIAVAAQPKLLPAAFLPLLVAQPKPRWRVLLAGAVLALGLFVLNEAVHPGLLKGFFRQLADPSQPWRYERGPNNCSVVGFLQHVLETAWRDRALASSWAMRLDVLWAAAVASLTALSLRRIVKDGGGEQDKRRRAMMLFIAAYALVVPRLKDYSFLLLIPPTIAALETDAPLAVRAAIVLFAVLDSTKALAEKIGMGRWNILAGYFKLYAAVLVWAVLALHDKHRPQFTGRAVSNSRRREF